MTHFIIGSGGQGRVIADILRSGGCEELVFVDEAQLQRDYRSGDVVLVGIGDNFSRAVWHARSRSQCRTLHSALRCTHQQ